jgi:hypothetical protein
LARFTPEPARDSGPDAICGPGPAPRPNLAPGIFLRPAHEAAPCDAARGASLNPARAANTGHLDIIRWGCPIAAGAGRKARARAGSRRGSESVDVGDSEKAGYAGPARACVALQRQRMLVGPGGAGAGVNPYHDWGESDPAEAADALFDLWAHPDRARAIGRRGAALVARRLTWRRFRDRLRSVIASHPVD